jgi:hypothetical protein
MDSLRNRFAIASRSPCARHEFATQSLCNCLYPSYFLFFFMNFILFFPVLIPQNGQMYLHRVLAVSYRLRQKEVLISIGQLFGGAEALSREKMLLSADLGKFSPEKIVIIDEIRPSLATIISSKEQDLTLEDKLTRFNDWFEVSNDCSRSYYCNFPGGGKFAH